MWRRGRKTEGECIIIIVVAGEGSFVVAGEVAGPGGARAGGRVGRKGREDRAAMGGHLGFGLGLCDVMIGGQAVID